MDHPKPPTETNGTLTPSERGPVNGEVQVLQPHPNFRLLMATDPSHGELSRAMRNRGVELYLDPVHIAEDSLRTTASNDMACPPSFPQGTACETLSFQCLCQGFPHADITFTARLFRGDFSRIDTVTNSLQLLADAVAQLGSATTESLVAFSAMVILPLEWNRALRTIATLGAQSQ